LLTKPLPPVSVVPSACIVPIAKPFVSVSWVHGRVIEPVPGTVSVMLGPVVVVVVVLLPPLTVVVVVVVFTTSLLEAIVLLLAATGVTPRLVLLKLV
jgi:hypothetical protein